MIALEKYSFFHSRKNPLALTVALDDSQLAEGRLYWDDGVRIGKYKVSCFRDKLTNSESTMHKYCLSLAQRIADMYS